MTHPRGGQIGCPKAKTRVEQSAEDERRGGAAEIAPPVSVQAAEVAGRDAPEALLPLDVILHAMRRKWRQGDHEGATTLAKAAAPYVHPRAAARRTNGLALIQEMDDSELEQLVRQESRSGGGADSATSDPRIADPMGKGGSRPE